MKDEKNSEPPKNESENYGCMAPILFWCGVALFLYVAQLFDSENPGAGKKIIVGALVIGVVWFFVYINLGSSVKETASNASSMAKKIAIFLVVMGALGILSNLTNCSNQSAPSPSDIYYRR